MNDTKLQDTTVFSLRLPKSLLLRLEKMAEKQRRTVSNLIRLKLEELTNGKKPVR